MLLQRVPGEVIGPKDLTRNVRLGALTDVAVSLSRNALPVLSEQLRCRKNPAPCGRIQLPGRPADRLFHGPEGRWKPPVMGFGDAPRSRGRRKTCCPVKSGIGLHCVVKPGQVTIPSQGEPAGWERRVQVRMIQAPRSQRVGNASQPGGVHLLIGM